MSESFSAQKETSWLLSSLLEGDDVRVEQGDGVWVEQGDDVWVEQGDASEVWVRVKNKGGRGREDERERGGSG